MVSIAISTNRGYSLIDILVGLALMGIICSMSIPNFTADGQLTLPTATRKIQSALDRSALLAQWSGIPCKITAENRFIFLNHENRQRLVLFQLPQDIQVEFNFSSIKNETQSLILWPTGTASVGHIEIRSQKTLKSCTIYQALLGHRRNQCEV